MTSNQCKTNLNLNAVTPDTMQALQKLLTEVTRKTAKMIKKDYIGSIHWSSQLPSKPKE